MAKYIHVTVAGQVATYHTRGGSVVCGNSCYYIKFNFDSEWDAQEVKTARFIYGGRHQDVVFQGDTVQVPILRGVDLLAVGVYAGDLLTTTPALIPCARSILCADGTPDAPTPDVYSQIIALLNAPRENLILTSDGKGHVTLTGELYESVRVYNLAERGLPAVELDGEQQFVVCDNVDILEIIPAAPAKLVVGVVMGESTVNAEFLVNTVQLNAMVCYCTCTMVYDSTPVLLTVSIAKNGITAQLMSLSGDAGTGEEEKEETGSSIPAFNLPALGLPAIPFDGSTGVATEDVAVDDVAAIMAALDAGPVKFTAHFMVGPSQEVPAEVVMNKISVAALGTYICAASFDYDGTPMILNLYVMEGTIGAYIALLANAEPRVTAIDMSAFDTMGQITETYEDGVVKTTTITFDETGNPVKITDGDGNETTLTW